MKSSHLDENDQVFIFKSCRAKGILKLRVCFVLWREKTWITREHADFKCVLRLMAREDLNYPRTCRLPENMQTSSVCFVLWREKTWNSREHADFKCASSCGAWRLEIAENMQTSSVCFVLWREKTWITREHADFKCVLRLVAREDLNYPRTCRL